MKPARAAYNFADAHAIPEHWHIPGKRYFSFNCSILAPEDSVTSVLEQLAKTLSLDDCFAVDLYEFGSRSNGSIQVRAYVFKHCSLDDHLFCLGSLEESEVDEIIELMNVTACVGSYAATEVISTEVRGRPVDRRQFKRRK